jgi:hypothetical protein
MQNPSVLATRATRKTTRFGLRDAKCNAAGAMHRVAWALQNSKEIGLICEKPWENQGLPAERTGTELFDVFPMFFEVRKVPFSLDSPPKNNPQSVSSCFRVFGGSHIPCFRVFGVFRGSLVFRDKSNQHGDGFEDANGFSHTAKKV